MTQPTWGLSSDFMKEAISFAARQYTAKRGIRRKRCLICDYLFDPNQSYEDDGLCNPCRDYDEYAKGIEAQEEEK